MINYPLKWEVWWAKVPAVAFGEVIEDPVQLVLSGDAGHMQGDDNVLEAVGHRRIIPYRLLKK